MSFNISHLISKITGGTSADADHTPRAGSLGISPSGEPKEHSFRQADTYKTIDEMRERIDDIAHEIYIEQDKSALFQKHKRENELKVERLFAEAQAGTFADSSALTKELARQKDFEVDPFDTIFESLTTESAHLRQAINERQQAAAREAFDAAVNEYAIQASRMTVPARRLREAAQVAGIRLDETNSPGLFDGSITINGNHIGLGEYTKQFMERERREAQAAGGAA
jgi:hypothetical protein